MLVSEHAAPAAVHYLPGGKPEPGEAPQDCLRREVGEQLGCEVIEPQLFAEVRAPAALKGVDMHMTVYLAELDGTPAPAAEIASLVQIASARLGGDGLVISGGQAFARRRTGARRWGRPKVLAAQLGHEVLPQRGPAVGQQCGSDPESRGGRPVAQTPFAEHGQHGN